MKKQYRRIEDKKRDLIERTLNYLNNREKSELHKFGLFYYADSLDEVDKDKIIKELPSVRLSKS